MSQPQAVMFDIGNVLIGWQPELVYDARIGSERSKAFFAEVPIHAANIEVDRGAPFHATIRALADAHPQWAEQVMWWHDDWLTMVTPVIEGSVATLRALKAKGVPIYALTNFGAETFVIAKAAFPFLTEFDHAFVSAHLGVIKPDPAIYRVVEETTGLRPEDLLFVDDKAENIAAAIARGWKGHVFDGWNSWAARLVTEGLLTTKEAGL